MEKKNLYTIGGCNGAGKATASFTILPEVIECKELLSLTVIDKVKFDKLKEFYDNKR